MSKIKAEKLVSMNSKGIQIKNLEAIEKKIGIEI